MKKKIKAHPPLPPFGLDMSPDEALARFIGTRPDEVEANIDKSKKKKPPSGKKKPPDGPKDQTVVSLRHRRMAKRNNTR